jgi:hypothetical protein
VTTESKACGQERRLIFKVLILGEDPALQAGFLNQASGESVSFQLYSTLGVGLGVASVRLSESCSAVLQLWSLPSRERYRGVTNNFVKGHRAIIIVLRPDEVSAARVLLEQIDTPHNETVIFAVIGEAEESETAIANLSDEFGVPYESNLTDSVSAVVKEISVNLADITASSKQLPFIVRIDPSLCPPIRPQAATFSTPPSSEEDVAVMKRLIGAMGVSVAGNHCQIELREGRAEVDLYLGSVKFHPRLCDNCKKGCKRTVNICIVGSDEGWSSDGLEKRSILTLAKVYGLSHRELPIHVERQLLHATQCSSFTWKQSDVTEEDETDFGYIPRRRRRTLLEVARNRVNEGRLSESIYNLLEQRFSSVRSRRDE